MAGDDEDDATGDLIVWPLERLARLMRAKEHEDGLNPAQWESLRYLARANRFSNSPGALTRYLGATKGTMVQDASAPAQPKPLALPVPASATVPAGPSN